MMTKELLEKYAKLIVKIGANLQEGQDLFIQAEPIHWPFVGYLERAAYALGARHIFSDLQHAQSKINKINNIKDSYLDYFPDYLEAKMAYIVREKAALIHLTGPEDPDCFESLDQQKNAIVEKTYRNKAKNLMSACMSGVCQWTIAPMPTPLWAKKILGGEANEKNALRLWEILCPILRLNQTDPLLAWEQHNKMLAGRIKTLDEMNIRTLIFRSPDTDLTIELNERSKWCGGNFTSSNGHSFNPNIPTEEVFTTPDFSKTSGKVQVTRPVMIMGKTVEKAWFEFENGNVIRYGAKTNTETLDKYFEIDPNARKLGEVALVDASSPIAQSNLIFHSILIDENASCHIALGRGISSAIKGGDTMTEKELEQAGCNMSLLHTDFMIGSPELEILAQTKTGQSITIMHKGCFKI